VQCVGCHRLVYVIGNQLYIIGTTIIGTRYDSKSTNERETPKHSPVKAHENPGDEVKSPAPQRQKTMGDFYKTLEGVV